ncbi:pimeloyl-CoA dehydrogenase large subunit [Vineibacter terrae]|uniref:Pimeloyl-CoA dehydrogenase large subunit n=1 Tax=Vineibacter terrae TaxID=2586908 RepID=A0A5C8PKF4_9HYPH|nr:acyl-CoA dehydrogenase family protein [Vineibacter terrae]TXL73834.1 pimeloyl-CoA dehydrogenase large subunit [Vineibacter terrae]
MDLNFSKADLAFRDEVRTFLKENLPVELTEKVRRGLQLDRDDYLTLHRVLYRKGWIAPAWPVEYGGTGWSLTQRYIFNEELAYANTPRVMPFGIQMVGPVIYTFGSAEQKAKYLPRILSGEDWWCQGYSEPGAGSDLASLRTRAVRDGDTYVVNGQKTWTSFAHYADHMFCLARTNADAKPQDGISFLLIDMRQPGVEVQPIVTVDGTADVNSVFLTDVKVPTHDLVGEENKGWTYAKFLLGHERAGIAAVGRSKNALRRLKEIARSETQDTRPLIEQRFFAEKIAQVEIDLTALEYIELDVLSRESTGKGPGTGASMLKVKGTDVQQVITELVNEAVGYYAIPYVEKALVEGWNEPPIGPEYAATAAPTYHNWRKASIYGGSTEVQKNIMAKMVLGL